MIDTVENRLGSGILAYWNAQDSAVGDGNEIASIADRVNGISLAQTISAMRPILRSDFDSTGYPAMDFDGIDDYLTVNNASLNVSKFAFLGAVKQTSAAVADTVYAVGNATYCRMMSNSASIGDFRLQNGGTSTQGALDSSGDINVVAGRCQSDGYFWIDNKSNRGNFTGTTVINSSSEHFMGSRSGTLQFFHGGIFAFCLVDLNLCAWYDVLAAQVLMRNDFGLPIFENLPQQSSGGGSGQSKHPLDVTTVS